MKNQIQKIIFSFSITYMIMLSILTINTLIKVENKLNITPNYPTKELQDLKKKIDLLDNTKCSQSIKNLYNASNTLMFNENDTLKTIYETINNNSIIPNYTEIIKNCNLTEKTKNELAPKIISATMAYEELRRKYFYQYEISIKDTLYREIAEANLTSSELQSGKYLEIEIIEKLIEVQNEE